MASSTEEISYSRTLISWLKREDSALFQAIDRGHTVFDVAGELEREPVAVLRRLDEVGRLAFQAGTEEWVEVMSLALSGVPLREVIDWCTASEDRMPFELIDSMRSEADLRAEFELARQLGILVPRSSMREDLRWLAAQPVGVRTGYAAAVARIEARFDALTPTVLRMEVGGLCPAELPVTWSPTLAPARGRGKARTRSGTSTNSTAMPRRAAPGSSKASTRTTTRRRRSGGIRNKWAYANWLKAQGRK